MKIILNIKIWEKQPKKKECTTKMEENRRKKCRNGIKHHTREPAHEMVEGVEV